MGVGDTHNTRPFGVENATRFSHRRWAVQAKLPPATCIRLLTKRADKKQLDVVATQHFLCACKALHVLRHSALTHVTGRTHRRRARPPARSITSSSLTVLDSGRIPMGRDNANIAPSCFSLGLASQPADCGSSWNERQRPCMEATSLIDDPAVTR